MSLAHGVVGLLWYFLVLLTYFLLCFKSLGSVGSCEPLPMCRLTIAFAAQITKAWRFFVLFFYLILYVPSTIFQLFRDGSSWGLTNTKLGLMCLAQGHYAVPLVRLEPAAPRSRVKHSTTEPLRSINLGGR